MSHAVTRVPAAILAVVSVSHNLGQAHVRVLELLVSLGKEVYVERISVSSTEGLRVALTPFACVA